MTEVILHLSAGLGPRECEWLVAELARVFVAEAAAAGLVAAAVEPLEGPSPSALLRVCGEGSDAFASARCGTIRWIGTSPFRPTHKRRNWFVGVRRVEGVDPGGFDEAGIRYQTLRASGPGGQHVNKTDSAVRATHVPTGLVAFSQDQRSQFANRRIARLKLRMLFEARTESAAAAGKRAVWEQNHMLERGNAVRTYEGERFRLVRWRANSASTDPPFAASSAATRLRPR